MLGIWVAAVEGGRVRATVGLGVYMCVCVCMRVCVCVPSGGCLQRIVPNKCSGSLVLCVVVIGCLGFGVCL